MTEKQYIRGTIKKIIKEMKRVVDIRTLHEIADSWNPSFKYIDDLDECADLINKPHEDYPTFVDSTKESIKLLLAMLEDNPTLVERDIKTIHRFCMNEKSYIRTGDYRMVNVRVGDSFEPCQPYLIAPFMMSIFPIKVGMGEEAIKEWYKLFETIHPFEDGNGRVGGIVIASLSFMETGRYLISI